MDYKILASVLLTWIKRILSQAIHQDQTGFYPKRYLRRNNILEYCEAHPEKQMVLILDADKAFDNVI